MEMKQIKREGYGSQFNNLFTDTYSIRKVAKNEYGMEKMKKEIAFYKRIEELSISFPLPRIYSTEKNGYTMKYYKDHLPLYKVYNKYVPEKRNSILRRIYAHLDLLHSSKYSVSTQVIERDILHEVLIKIERRLESVYSVIQPYLYIDSVNSTKLLSYDSVMETLCIKILECIKLKGKYEYSILHGDCQFNNILYNEEQDDLLFIDPRGYFGLTELYGLAEYDTAKIQFALSGYDVFDNMEINHLNIEGSNLILPSISLEDTFLDCEPLIKYLVISIWLGNAHCFKENPSKAVFSYYYALYLGTLVFNDEKSLMKYTSLALSSLCV